MPRGAERISCRAALAGCLTLAAFVVPRGVRAQHATADTLIGRVTTSDGRPLPDATVIATSGATGRKTIVRVDAEGKYVIVTSDTSPTYDVAFLRLGHLPARVTVSRGTGGKIAVPAAHMDALATELDVVRVVAERPRARLYSGRILRPAQHADPVRGTDIIAAGEKRDDLAQLAATVPGVTLTAGDNGTTGISIGGAPPSQSNITLDGMDYRGAMPMFGLSTASVRTSAYVGSAGGFSAGQVTAAASVPFSTPTALVNLFLTDPSLQYAGPGARARGVTRRDLRLGTRFTGPLWNRRLGYSLSTDLNASSRSVPSLSSLPDATLRALGIAADSVTRLRQVLTDLRIPFDPDAAPSADSRSVNGLWLMMLSETPTNPLGAEVRVDFKLERSAGLGISPTALNSAAATSERFGRGVQAKLWRPIGGASHILTAYGWTSESRGAHELAFPGGMVGITSQDASGQRPRLYVPFGGQSFLPRRREWGLQARHEAVWRSWSDTTHQFELATEAKLEGSRSDPLTALGNFAFESLDDLARGRPAWFARRLDAAGADGAVRELAASFTDAWRPRENLSVIGSIRFESAEGLRPPPFDPALERRFGVRTDRMPWSTGVSPRLSFNWAPVNRGLQPWGVFQIGGGLYRSRLSPATMAAARDNTLRQLFCVGATAPAPSWHAYAANPSAAPADCSGASAAGPSASPLRTVTTLAPDYEPAWSRKLELGWERRLPRWASISVTGRIEDHFAQPGIVDLNLARDPAFYLEDEARRPVFAPPAAFVPASGVADPRSSRVDTTYGAIAQLRSDERRTMRQLEVTLAPRLYNPERPRFGITYLYTTVREQARGLTGDDPRALAWSPATRERRHELSLSLDRVPLGGGVQLGMQGRVFSGFPFTPRVRGDVGATGGQDDPAFVFDPASPQAGALAGDMAALLRDAPPYARTCLEQQLGRIAGRNSCRGPWGATLDLWLIKSQPFLAGAQWGTIQLRLTNLPGALDYLVHGEGGRQGWGDLPMPDPTLLVVRGFDPSARRFLYNVNPRFGTTDGSRALFRTPFSVSIQVTLNFSTTIEHQALRNRAANLGVSVSDTTVLFPLARLTGRSAYRKALDLATTMRLTPEQIRTLDSLDTAYEARLRERQRPHVLRLSKVIGSADDQELARLLAEAREVEEPMVREGAATLRAMLTQAQWEALDFHVHNDLEGRHTH